MINLSRDRDNLTMASAVLLLAFAAFRCADAGGVTSKLQIQVRSCERERISAPFARHRERSNGWASFPPVALRCVTFSALLLGSSCRQPGHFSASQWASPLILLVIFSKRPLSNQADASLSPYLNLHSVPSGCADPQVSPEGGWLRAPRSAFRRPAIRRIDRAKRVLRRFDHVREQR